MFKVPEDDADAVRRSLKHDKLSTAEFDHLWKACSQSRLKDIRESATTTEIFKEWPEYKQPQGFRLVSGHFNLKLILKLIYLIYFRLILTSMSNFKTAHQYCMPGTA